MQHNLECTFTPEISKTDIFDICNTSIKYDRPTKNYFERVNKAKKHKEEIKSKLNPNYIELYDQRVKKNKLNLSEIMNKVINYF